MIIAVELPNTSPETKILKFCFLYVFTYMCDDMHCRRLGFELFFFFIFFCSLLEAVAILVVAVNTCTLFIFFIFGI